MKKLIPLFLCLLLCGCAQELPETQTEVPAAATEAPSPESLYDPSHPLNAEGLKAYPLPQRKVQAIRTMGEDLLVFSGYGSTTLTRLTGEDLTPAGEVTLDFSLEAEDPSLRIGAGFLSYFDPTTQETVVRNQDLKEVTRIGLSETVTGSPILSSDRSRLYYCTEGAILAWDLETGNHRTVKQLSYNQQLLVGLHLEDTVLQCRIQDETAVRTLFLSAETGQMLYQRDGDMRMTTRGQNYCASLPTGAMELLIFGDTSEKPRMLCPEDLGAEAYCLPEAGGAVTVSTANREDVLLHFYSLDSGSRLAQLTLDPLLRPKSITATDSGSCWLLVYDPDSDCDTILRWSFPPQVPEKAVYTGPYAPGDTLALLQCQNYAAELSEKYGIQIHIAADALAVQPWDYDFQEETLPMVLHQELSLLEERLGIFPEGMLEKACSHFSSLHLCLVRQITGTAESGSLDTATGVQFFEGTDAYVTIAVGRYSQQALFHELFHVMETHILNESIAFDQWGELNPTDFAYSYGYEASDAYDCYLSGSNRAFIDRYSMSFPKEDRARIWEYAILGGNRELFQAAVLQNKLTKLCTGIREAYGLRKSPETFLWEQYLQTPLAYTG